MAARRKIRQREAQLAFEALTIEGGLLSPEWLAKVAQLQAAHQTDGEYRVLKGLNLRDEIGRYWRIAQAKWSDFQAGLKSNPPPDVRQALADAFVHPLLRDSFGFESLAASSPVVIGERSYPVRHRSLGGRVPVVIAPAESGLDTLAPVFGDGTRRRSAFGLAQELLNADENALWGLVTDGVTLRILRDNASLTRPAWIEADLGRIFAEERYADFAALWLVIHETRFGAPGHPISDCALEAWRAAGREQGTRAREHLRNGVEEALVALGRGFLVHPENQQLRVALHDGSLTKDAYFQQLLRLVYRLIFLLTAEERGVLHPSGADEKARERYEAGYGLRRLRDRSVKRSAHDRFSDLWGALKIVLRGVGTGEPRLALPALGGLFANDQCPDLDCAKLENRALLTAVFRLSWLREESGLSRVNWRDMGPEELGSVYESLLELVPQIPQDERGFSFATGDETRGNARKTTGSYYTPDTLVQVLLDSALEPVVQAAVAAHPGDPAAAVLALSVVDPACGSGHFLLAAARRLAGHVARLQANGTPSAAEYRHALREVVSRSVFGVDLNPMAVELCRVSLWMEAVEPGRPLSFLDSHIQQGNALLGAMPELMGKGVPDAAWEPIEGDDRKTASILKKRNKAAAEGQRSLESLWTSSVDAEKAEVVRATAELDAASDASLAEVAGKEARWEQLQTSSAFRHQKFVADAWCAAFVWPKPPVEPKKPPPPLVEAAPTNDLWRQIRDGQGQTPALTAQTVDELTRQYRFFHWHLAFPQVFARGGFDVVLGNPPWERVKLQEQEFFASRDEAIATALNAAARKKLIAKLSESNPILWAEWCAASRLADGESHYIRHSGRYPLCGKGDVNTYAVFAEHNRATLGAHGRGGFIVPSGLATDDTTKDFFQALIETRSVAAMWEFENEGFFSAGKGHMLRFALTTLVGSAAPSQKVDFAFQCLSLDEWRDRFRHFSVSASEIELVNPNTRTCPIFKTQRDAELNFAIYRRVGVLWREGGPAANPWNIRFMRMLDMAVDSSAFHTRAALAANGYSLSGCSFEGPGGRFLPLYEAKMAYLYNHRHGSFAQTESGQRPHRLPEATVNELNDPQHVALPCYWVAEGEVEKALASSWKRRWLLGWRDVTDARASIRTVVACVIPRVGVGDKFLLMLPEQEPLLIAALYANLSSFVFDYCARQKVGGISLKYFTMKQLPVLPPSNFIEGAKWSSNTTTADWLLPRVLELSYTAWDLAPFAEDVGHDGPPFRWDPERRALLRAELDAAFLHLYGISRDDAMYILDTFPIVRKNDQKAHGEYRTKRVILEIYDAIAAAIRSGRPYQTRLDPPPADPRVAHPARQAGPHYTASAGTRRRSN